MFGRPKPSLSVSQVPRRSGQPISRRDLLRLGGGLALGAGLVSVAACGSTASGGGSDYDVDPSQAMTYKTSSPIPAFTPLRSRSGSTMGANLQASS